MKDTVTYPLSAITGDEEESRIDQLERELAEVKEQLRLCNVDQFTTAAELADAVTKERGREWVGLTDEERRGLREWQKIQEELGPVWAPMMLYLYEALEAKLKEKNSG